MESAQVQLIVDDTTADAANKVPRNHGLGRVETGVSLKLGRKLECRLPQRCPVLARNKLIIRTRGRGM